MLKTGKIIVLEGTDGSGKGTQGQLLYEKLKADYKDVRKIQFPDYDSESSGPVKMYLRGDFGNNPDDVNPFAASTFYAVDRFASFTRDWREFYNNGGIIISDRYTTSNMVHQAAKIDKEDELREFLIWLTDLEFNKLGLPRPDIVFFLNVDPIVSNKLLEKRQRQNNEKADIHEADKSHLSAAYHTACQVAELYQWQFIECVDSGKLRSINDIHEEMYQRVKELLK